MLYTASFCEFEVAQITMAASATPSTVEKYLDWAVNNGGKGASIQYHPRKCASLSSTNPSFT